MRRLTQILAIVMIALAPVTAYASPPEVGDIAPNFQLTLVDGSRVSLSELRGQVVVLNFWATWCVPCLTELPLLDRYYRINRPHGLRVFAVTTEDSVPLRQMRRVFAAMAIPSVRRISGPYAVLTGVPTNYVIDHAGRIRYAAAGAFDLDDLNRILVPLLREPAPPVTP